MRELVGTAVQIAMDAAGSPVAVLITDSFRVTSAGGARYYDEARRVEPGRVEDILPAVRLSAEIVEARAKLLEAQAEQKRLIESVAVSERMLSEAAARSVSAEQALVTAAARIAELEALIPSAPALILSAD